MNQFRIILKNEKRKTYQLISWIILFTHLLFFGWLAISSTGNMQTGALITLILLGMCLITRFYFRGSRWETGFHVFFFICAAGWIITGLYWLAIIPLLFDLLRMTAMRDLIVNVSTQKISYPAFPQKDIDWKELYNTILKDGLLTIDFRNNKLIQQSVDEERTIVNEQEFNEFCSQQLKK